MSIRFVRDYFGLVLILFLFPWQSFAQFSTEKSLRNLLPVLPAIKGAAVISPELAEIYARQRIESMEERAIIEQMLAVPEQFLKKYEKVTKKSDTGIFRIFEDRDCYYGKTVNVDELERCADVPPVMGGGSYYSFRFKQHFGHQDRADIHLKDGRFVFGNSTVQSFAVDLGEIELSDLNNNSKVFSFIKEFVPSRTVNEIASKNKELEVGISANGFVYSNTIEAKLRSTYAARIISFHIENEREKRAYPSQMLVRGHDILLAFKIVGHGDDGSLVILWRSLRHDYPHNTISRK